MNLPEGYTGCVSKTRRYQLLGSGFDCAVVRDIFSQMLGIRRVERAVQQDFFV